MKNIFNFKSNRPKTNEFFKNAWELFEKDQKWTTRYEMRENIITKRLKYFQVLLSNKFNFHIILKFYFNKNNFEFNIILIGISKSRNPEFNSFEIKHKNKTYDYDFLEFLLREIESLLKRKIY